MIYSYPRERRSPGWRLEDPSRGSSAQGRKEEFPKALACENDPRPGGIEPAVSNLHVRHRAVERLEGEPSQVARTSADATEGHLGHSLCREARNQVASAVNVMLRTMSS